jgi:hypothetical protein
VRELDQFLFNSNAAAGRSCFEERVKQKRDIHVAILPFNHLEQVFPGKIAPRLLV